MSTNPKKIKKIEYIERVMKSSHNQLLRQPKPTQKWMETGFFNWCRRTLKAIHNSLKP